MRHKLNLKATLSFVVICTIVSCSPIYKYKDTKEVLSWENDIRNFERLDSTEKDPEHAILFTGSSSIRLWSTIEEDMAPYNTIQRGYGGAKFDDFAVYCERIIYPHHFDALVIFVANDIVGNENDKTPKQVLDLFNYVVNTVRQRYKHQPIFFIEITPTRARWNAWSKIQEANGLIKKWCMKNDAVYFIETHQQFLNEDGFPKENLYRSDKLHLNVDGYKVWSEIIKTNLSNVLNPKAMP